MPTQRVLLLVSAVATALAVAGCDRSPYHPEGFAAGAMHGPALKQQDEDCRACHGDALTGGLGSEGVAPGCDDCHSGATPTTWRTNCTFCHGGVETDTGAPPRNLDGTDQVGPFPAHTAHVTGSALAGAYDCDQCHTKAIDVLSPGHVFDDTPGEAENDFGNGVGPQTRFTAQNRTCSNNYCHGDGRGDNGTVAALAPTFACQGCHPIASDAPSAWSAMSGAHALHLQLADVGCADCHGATTTDGTTIAEVGRHIDGKRDVAFSVADFAFADAAQTCTGSCHGVDHGSFGWDGGGANPHPPGFSDPLLHGPEMELGRSDCRGCHGADLTGGSGQSCDNCHTADWRTDCTYCHGGGLDATGAPPHDLGSTDTSVAQSFVAHSAHVNQGIAAASECDTCHRQPVDVLSPGHAFDDTPGVAETDFSGGLSPATVLAADGTCSNNYCHGNGRSNGSYRDGAAPPTCTTCHPTNNLGGEHGEHDRFACDECHRTVASSSSTILAPALHVDGLNQVVFQIGTITWNPANQRCNGPCHEDHENDSW